MVLTKTNRKGRIAPILQSLHMFPVTYGIDLKALSLVFEALKHIGPTYIHDLFQQCAQMRSLSSQNKHLLALPTVSAKCGQRLVFMLLDSGPKYQMRLKLLLLFLSLSPS